MANGTEIRALELGEQIAQKQNVYIVDVTYKKADDTYSLCYYICLLYTSDAADD